MALGDLIENGKIKVMTMLFKMLFKREDMRLALKWIEMKLGFINEQQLRNWMVLQA